MHNYNRWCMLKIFFKVCKTIIKLAPDWHESQIWFIYPSTSFLFLYTLLSIKMFSFCHSLSHFLPHYPILLESSSLSLFFYPTPIFLSKVLLSLDLSLAYSTPLYLRSHCQEQPSELWNGIREFFHGSPANVLPSCGNTLTSIRSDNE